MAGPRFTIARLMIVVALVAGGLGLVRAVGPCPVASLATLLGAGYLSFRGSRRVAVGHPNQVVAVVVLTSGMLSFPVGIRQAYTLGVDWFDTSTGFLFLATPVLVGATFGWAVARFRGGPTRRRVLGLAALVVVILLPWSMVWTNWPLYLAFRQAEPALTALADRIEAGEAVAFPARAGIYTIEGGQHVVVNLTDGTLLKIGETGYHTGFVRDSAPPDDRPSMRSPDLVGARHRLGNRSGPFWSTGGWRFTSDWDPD